MTRLVVGGLDLSLTSTGMCTIELGGPAPLWTLARSGRTGKNEESLLVRKQRLRTLQHDVIQQLLHCDLVLIEAPAYSAGGGHAHDRSGVWWFIVDELVDLGATVMEVGTQHLKIYATGRGQKEKTDDAKAFKQRVLANAIRRYGAHVEINVDDEADATILAAMGARYLGHPVEDSLPQTHLRVMDMVKWPTVPVEVVPLAGALL